MRKKTLIWLALALLLSFQCGCGTKTEEPIEITLMHGWGGTLRIHTVMQEIYEEFQKENPDIVLTCVASSDSSVAVDNANNLLSVGKIPDIVSTNGLSYYVNNAVKLGEALDLMPYIERDPAFAAEIHPQVLEVWTTEDGGIYTLPDALEIMGYWYNEDLLLQAGWQDAEGKVRLPSDWEEFFEMCGDLEKTLDGEEAVVRLEDVQVSENFFYARLRGSAELAETLHPDLKECVASPAFDRTVEDTGRLYEYSDNADSLETAREKFSQGKTALYFNGIWESQLLAEASVKARFACYPTEMGKSLVYVSPSSGYLVAAHEDKRKDEACVRFLKYLLSESTQKKLAEETSQAPENPAIDSGLLREESPFLGTALETADEADIQIVSLSTEWNSRAAELLSTYLTQGIQSEDAVSLLKKELLASGQ